MNPRRKFSPQPLPQSSKVSLLSLLLVSVREVRFRLGFSRLGAIGDELLEVQRDFLEDRLEAACGGGCSQEPTADLSLDLVDFQRAVDLVGGTGIKEGIGGDIGGQCIEVVEDRLGAEILARRMPRQAGGMLQLQPVLDPFERLFDLPTIQPP